MKSRIPGVREEFLTGLFLSIERQLAVHLKNLTQDSPSRKMYSWNAVANDYRQLASIAYAAGESILECRRLLVECARAYLEVVKLRGNGSQSAPDWTPTEYSTANSCSTFLVICRAFSACDMDLAKALAPWVWDPENAKWLSPKSVVCTPHQQRIAYALRDFLLGRVAEAQRSLDGMEHIREDTIGPFLMLRGIVHADRNRVLKGLGLTLNWHHRIAQDEYFDPEYFLCIPALGLLALAIQQKIIGAEDLPADDVYLPRDLAVC